MNVAALLQDSPSDDRRRASNNAPQQPPHTQPHPQHPASDAPPTPQPPPSPQWPRASASSSRTQTWPPPFIRPASAHSDSAPPKDPAWSPVSPKSYYSLLDNRTIPPPPSASLLQRGRAGSQSSAHAHTPSPAAAGPYAKAPSSSSSPSTPFHPHPSSPRQPRLPPSTGSPRVHPSLSASNVSSFPAPLAHISPAAPPTRPGPAEPLLGADSTGGPPPGGAWGHSSGVTGHVMGSNNLNLMDRHNIPTGPALAGSVPPTSSLNSTTAGPVSARHTAIQPTSPMDGLRDNRDREREPRERDRDWDRDWDRESLRERERMQPKDMGAPRDPVRERADSLGQRERERERTVDDKRRRPSNAASSALVGPGTGGPPPYLLSNDNKPAHSHMDSARPSLSPSISSRTQHHPSLSTSSASNINPSMSSSASVRMHSPPPMSRRPSGASRDADVDVIPRERDLRDARDPRDMRDMRDPRDIGLRDLRDMRDLRDIGARDPLDLREREREPRLREIEMRGLPDRDGLREREFREEREREREREREFRERERAREFRERERDLRDRERDREFRERELRNRELRDGDRDRDRDFFKEHDTRDFLRGAPQPPTPASASLSASVGPPPSSYLPPPGSAGASVRDREQQQRERERDIHREHEQRADMELIRAMATSRQQQSGLPGQQQVPSQQQQQGSQQQQQQRDRERESRPPIGPGVIPSGPPLPPPSSIGGGGPSGVQAPIAAGERRQGTPEGVMLKHVQYERERLERERLDHERERDRERERMDRDRERERLDRERAERERMERDRERMERERLQRDRTEREYAERDKERERDRDNRERERERAAAPGSGARTAAPGAYPPPPSASSTSGPGGAAPPRDRRDREREQTLSNPHPFIHPQGHLHQHSSQTQQAQAHHQQPPPHPSHPSHSHIHPSHAHAYEPRSHGQTPSRQASTAPPPLSSTVSGGAASSHSPPSSAQQSMGGISAASTSSNANPGAGVNTSSVPGTGPPPQKQFQTQFHTQFVPGLHQQRMDPSGAGPVGGVILGGDRERGREVDRDGRDRAGSRLGSPVPMSMSGAVGPGLGMGMPGDKRELERDGKRSGRSSVVGKDERERDRERLRDRHREIGREKGREMYAQALKPGGERERDKDREHERNRDRDRRVDEGMYGEPGMGYPTHPRMSASAQMHLDQQQKQQLGYHPQHQARLSSSQLPGQPLHPDSMMVDDHPPPPMSHPGLYPMHSASHAYGPNPTVSPDFGPHGHQLRERERRDRDRDRERERDDRDVDMSDAAAHEAQMQMQNQQWHMMAHPSQQQQHHVRGPSGGGSHGTIGLGMPEEVWYDAGHPLTLGHGPGAEYPMPRRDRERERDRLEREREREYQDIQRGHSHPHPHPHIHSHQQQQLQIQQQQQQQQGLPLHLQPQALNQPGMHGQVPPPLLSADSELLQDEEEYLADEWDEWRADADGESKRARVRVDLGTWVYPKLPFPYFFELGDGLVGLKEREEEKERKEKERLERERKEEERVERERAEKERKEKAEKEQKEQEEKERKEKEVKEQERARMEKEKEELEAKAAEAARAAQSMEEGEINEEEEKAKMAKWEAEKQVQKLKEEERAKEQEKVVEKEKQEIAASEKLEEKVKRSPSIISPPSSAPIVPSTSALLDDPLPEPQQPPLDLETRTTILIPNGFIPTEKPLRPRIWGGGGFDPNPHPRPPLPMRSRSGRKGKVGAGTNGKRTRPLLSAKTSHSTLVASSADTNGSITVNGKPRQQSMRSRRTRRIYTDDSDVFLCAVHSGWLTWSGARKARARGRDLRIEVRVLRCAGTGAGSLFARGAGIAGATRAPGDPEIVREEIVGRFVGGYGERCFNPLGQSGRVAGEEGEEGFGATDGLGLDGSTDSELLYDDPEDDGRCLVSAAWGTGHDGSAIEIVGVEFVERGTAHKAPGVGRRNRAQRLLEYAERRASVLGHQVGCIPLNRTLAGRKRRRGWDGWPVQPRRLPNATMLDVILEEPDEAEEDEDDGRPKKKTKVQEEEEKLMETRTLVFGIGANADLCVGYKYVPTMLKEILFPSAQSSIVDSTSSRKRRHVQEIEDVEMANAETPIITGPTSTPRTQRTISDLGRSVILETAKESYLFSPCIPTASDRPAELSKERAYELALILETETEVLEEDPIGTDGGDKLLEQVEKLADATEQFSGPDSGKDDLSVINPLPAFGEGNTAVLADSTSLSPPKILPGESLVELAERSSPSLPTSTPAIAPITPLRVTTPPPRSISPSRASPVHSPEPEVKDPSMSSPSFVYRRRSLTTEDEVEADKIAMLPVQVLQRNMSENMFRFTDDGVYVLDGSASDGMETEWVIQVKNWKWAPNHKGAREKL